jgi:hypothetical protein
MCAVSLGHSHVIDRMDWAAAKTVAAQRTLVRLKWLQSCCNRGSSADLESPEITRNPWWARGDLNPHERKPTGT